MTAAAAGGRLALVPADPGPEIVAVSASMRTALAEADRYARSGLPVLIIGETGTGKELIARRIHARSGRQGELVAVNCAELVPEQAANLLFGHRRGAYTGANESTRGFVRRSSRGTLFLDEITSLPLESQPTLLRVIETGEVTPVGEDGSVRVDLRIVAAAHPSLRRALVSGAARQDLFERLAVGTITLAPLRDRQEDIIPLARSFARQHDAELTDSAASGLLGHAWPGNVRELRSVVLRAVMLARGRTVTADAIAQGMRGSLSSRFRAEHSADREDERRRLEALCDEAEGDWRRLATLLGVGKTTMYKQLRAHGLTLRRRRYSGAVPRKFPE